MRIFLIGIAMLALAGQAAAEPVVIAKLLPDGRVEIEGQAFVQVPSLKAKLTEIKRRTPAPVLQLTASRTLTYRDAAIDMVLLERSGLPANIVAKKVIFY